MNNMHWEIITNNGLLLKENNNIFINDPKEIKIAYFTDNNIHCGINKNLTFFLNHTVYDLKLNQNVLKFFQYKENTHGLMDGNNNTVFCLGVNTEDNKYNYTYTLRIDTYSIVLVAQKFDGNELIQNKNIVLL